jgi:hypothetical protein
LKKDSALAAVNIIPATTVRNNELLIKQRSARNCAGREDECKCGVSHGAAGNCRNHPYCGGDCS